jgi:hypothetical protein
MMHSIDSAFVYNAALQVSHLTKETPSPFYTYFLPLIISFTSSFIFLFLMYCLRPRIKIAPVICKVKRGNEYVYKIKVFNKSRIFKAIDINVELIEQTTDGAPTLEKKTKVCNGATNIRIKKMDLVSHQLWCLPRRSSKDPHALYAFQFTCTDNVEKILDENKSIRFKVLSKHGLSGFPRVTYMEYKDKQSSIEEGRYYWGNSCQIKPTNRQ